MRLELKLKEIHLQNFRLFDDLKVSFDEQLTVFISENGAGKTSLLEGIAKTLFVFTDAIVSNGFTFDFGEVVTTRNIHYVQSEPAYHSAPVESTDNDIQFGKKSLTISNSIDCIVDNIISNQKISITKQRLKNDELLQTDKLRELGGNMFEALVQDKFKCLPIVMYYPSERAHFRSNDMESENTILSIYENALIGKPMIFKHFLEWYIWQSQKALFSKTPNLVLEQVQFAILSMLNDEQEKNFNDLYIDPSQFRNPRLMVSKNGNKVEINQLSSGEKNLFVLVSDLARRLCLANPKSTDPLKEGQGVVLIDEIDLNLHPRWQRKILTKLKTIFPKIQWIVTSHSPLVLSYAPAGKVFKLSNGQVQEYKYFRGMRLMDIFYDLYNITSRPQLIQNQIDALFESVDAEHWQKAQTQLNELKLILPEHDPAIVEAQTSLKLAS